MRVRLLGGNDEWCPAVVFLASRTIPASSVALVLKGAVRTGDGGMILGMLPILVNYTERTVKSLLDDEYEIEVTADDRN